MARPKVGQYNKADVHYQTNVSHLAMVQPPVEQQMMNVIAVGGKRRPPLGNANTEHPQTYQAKELREWKTLQQQTM